MRLPAGSLAYGAAAAAVLAGYKLYSLSRQRFRVHRAGTVVVSGCSSGIGKHAAFELARRGYTVLAGVRSASDAAALSSEAAGLDLTPVMLDVTSPESVAAVLDRVRSSTTREKPLVALVNNAGVSLGFVVEQLDEAEMRQTYEVNVFGTYRLTAALLPLLRESQGRVVNVSSVEGLYARAGKALYGSSKYAVEGLSDALRRELGPLGVSVSVVEPGAVASEMLYRKAPAGRERHFDRPAAQAHYKPLVDRLRKQGQLAELDAAGALKVPGPAVTSDAIAHAVGSAYPRVRYPVSTLFVCSTATLARMLWVLPTRVADRLGL